MQRGEMSAIEYLDLGYAMVRVAYLTDHMDASGAVQRTNYTMFLIHQKTDWKFWFTTSP